MLVFIDELGDAGLDVAGGASPIFVAAMVVFIHDAAAAATQRAIDDRDARRLPRREFKFSKCRDEVRDRFFDAVRGCDFNVRRDRCAEGQDAFAGAAGGAELIHEFFVELLMRRSEDALADAKVIIDGSGSKSFRQRSPAGDLGFAPRKPGLRRVPRARENAASRAAGRNRQQSG